MKIKQTIFVGIVVLYVLFAFIRVLFPDLDHGDEFADANVLNAGMNFVKFGFLKTCFLPSFEAQQSVPGNVYLTCPPGPEIFNGFLRKYLNINSLYVFRIISLLISFLGAIFWYLFIKKVTDSSEIALLALFFYICHPSFLYGFDSLHECSLSEVFKSGILYLAAVFLKTENRQHKNLAWVFMCVFFFLVSFITYQYIVYFALFLPLFWRWHGRKVFCREIYLLLAVPIASFLLHMAQVICYLGGAMKALGFMKATLVRRVIDSPDAPGKLDFSAWFRMLSYYFSEVLIFPLSLIIVLFLGSIIFYLYSDAQAQDKARKALKLLFMLFLCGMSWYVLFPAHSFAHMYVGFLERLIVPCAVIGLSIFAYLFWKFAVKSGVKLYLVFWCFFVFLLGWMMVQNSVLPVNSEKIFENNVFVKFKKCLTILKNEIRESDIVGANYYRSPFIRFYTDRNVVCILTAGKLTGMEKLPEYFIFMPYEHKLARSLWKALKVRYDVFLRCQVIILKLKGDQGRRN